MIKDEPKIVAAILSRALPYVQRYDGAIIVIKFGGHAMLDTKTMQNFARDIVLMRQVGVNPVIVHGGGPSINNMLARLNLKSEFKNGKRITDKNTIEIVEMVLSGQINKKIVGEIIAQGGQAVGLSGKDSGLLECTINEPELGFVGTPKQVNSKVIDVLMKADIIPVISPISFAANADTVNVNGDIFAGAIAAALKADRLLLLTDVAGVKDGDGKIISQLNIKKIDQLIEQKIIDKGMIPKTITARDALKKDVRGVVILDGRTPNACLRELFSDSGAGTLIRL